MGFLHRTRIRLSDIYAKPELRRKGQSRKFATESDFFPDFCNFLLGLEPSALPVELIQNGLDARSTWAVISFERDRLVCEGNETPIDKRGDECRNAQPSRSFSLARLQVPCKTDITYDHWFTMEDG